MNEIVNNLHIDEKVLCSARLIKVKFLKIIVINILIYCFLIILNISYIIGIIITAVTMIDKIKEVIRKSGREFIVTNKKVIVIIKSCTSEFLLEKIEGCDVENNNIVIKGTGGTKHDNTTFLIL